MEKQLQVRIPPETTRQVTALKALWGDATLTLALARAVERVYHQEFGGQPQEGQTFTEISQLDANCTAEDDV